MGRKKVGLVLGGGAARGFAHIGVLKVIEEAKVPVDCIAGASAGGLMGALFCAGLRWEDVAEIITGITWGKLISFRPSRKGFFLPDKMERYLDHLIAGKRFEDLAVPFAVTAVDAQTGECIILDSGNIASAVRASCSVPGVFHPYERDGRMLIDGGMKNSVPADVVKRMGAEFIVAINLNGDRFRNGYPKNIFQIVRNTLDIIISNNTLAGLPYIDVMIEPDLRMFKYGSLRHKWEMIRCGEEAMSEVLPDIQKVIREVSSI